MWMCHSPSEEGVTATGGFGATCPSEERHAEQPEAQRLGEDTALLCSRSPVRRAVWGDWAVHWHERFPGAAGEHHGVDSLPLEWISSKLIVMR